MSDPPLWDEELRELQERYQQETDTYRRRQIALRCQRLVRETPEQALERILSEMPIDLAELRPRRGRPRKTLLELVEGGGFNIERHEQLLAGELLPASCKFGDAERWWWWAGFKNPLCPPMAHACGNRLFGSTRDVPANGLTRTRSRTWESPSGLTRSGWPRSPCTATKLWRRACVAKTPLHDVGTATCATMPGRLKRAQGSAAGGQGMAILGEGR